MKSISAAKNESGGINISESNVGEMKANGMAASGWRK
jgi:hypothetical protein